MGESFSFGAWVRRRRKALDLTQDALARRVGCALSMIRKIEADERKPSRQIAALLASALEIPAADHEQFMHAARAELAVDKLAAPQVPLGPEAQLSALPSGTVTFLFTDIAGSTRLWEQHPAAMQPALARHDSLLRNAIAAHGGTLVKGTGDGMHAAFARATDGVHAALAAQRTLSETDWRALGLPQRQSMRVRMALHMGVTDERGGDYFGPAVNRAARLLAAGHGGQILLSQAMCEVVRDHLPPGAALRDLGAHRLKDLSREEQIFQLTVPDLPADFPPLAALSTRRHNLPIQPSSFVGRANELAEIARLLGSTHLLTLTGPGGTGKTRLSLQVAAALLAGSHEPGDRHGDRFPNGVWLIELAPLADPALVPQAVASALELREDAGRPLLATLTDFLRPKELLLIVDNCEHVVDACAQLADTLLRACPNVRILASSREALGIAGEVVWRVPPLAVPPTESRTENLKSDQLGALAQVESIRLFIERAATILPDFTLTTVNASALAQICRRLDGIPLAIELAAARVTVLRVEQIAARLDDRFRLLTGGSRTAMPRQQTLRALIDWSYDLLAESERLLLGRLAVFAGGWTLEAAEAVCAGRSLHQDDVLDFLTQLINKSLVVAERAQGQETRYRLLETIRQYASERLAASSEADAVRQRHAEHFLALAEESEPQLRGADQSVWLARLEMEHDNLRAALAWALGGGDAAIGVRLASAQAWFWYLRGYSSEGRAWLEAALAVPPGLEERTGAWAAARGTALRWAGVFVQDQGDQARAMALLEESLALFRALGDQHGLAETLFRSGDGAWLQGDYARTTALYQEALALYQEFGERPRIADTLHYLGDVAREQGDYAQATRLLEESLALHRELGDRGVMGGDLLGLGDVALYQSDVARAVELYQEAQAFFWEVGFEGFITWALRGLGSAAHAQGDTTQAVALLEECVVRFRETGADSDLARTLHLLGAAVQAQGDIARAAALLREGLVLQRQQGLKHEIAESLERFALLAVGQGQPGRAVRLLGAAEALRAVIGAPLPPVERPDYDRAVATARAQLGEAAFAAAWAAGQQLTLEEAVAEALAEMPNSG